MTGMLGCVLSFPLIIQGNHLLKRNTIWVIEALFLFMGCNFFKVLSASSSVCHLSWFSCLAFLVLLEKIISFQSSELMLLSLVNDEVSRGILFGFYCIIWWTAGIVFLWLLTSFRKSCVWTNTDYFSSYKEG